LSWFSSGVITMGNSGFRSKQHRNAARSIGQASVAALLAMTGLALPTISQAQELQEITVTATKRGETALQDTALSITALGTETLESMGADSAVDFLRSVPGLVFEDQGIGDKKYSIRGVQSVGAATVAVYFDDLVLTANNRQDGGGRNVDPK